MARALDDAAARIAELEAALASEQARRADVEADRDRLRDAYEALKRDVELARRRLVIAKAERVDTVQLELEFETMLAALNALAPADDEGDQGDDRKNKKPKAKAKHSKGGRRDLRLCDLPEERVEITDASLEGRVARIGTEESCELRWRRGGFVRLVLVRFKYDLSKPPKVEVTGAAEGTALAGEYQETAASSAGQDSAAATGAELVLSASSEAPETERPMPHGEPAKDHEAVIAPRPACPIVTAPMPPRILGRSLATPSLIAHIASDKFCDGLPLHRQEDRFARLDVPLDRGTMCCWLEEVGATVGATVVEAMRQEALHTAFCIATDATGVLVQPEPRPDGQRQPCRRAHFFVQIADADHVFFEYTRVETSEVVSELFRDFSGYVQADAKSVFDNLFRPPDERDRADDRRPDLAVRHEVACWSHARTKFWETAVATQDVVAREALARIMRMFQLERAWKDRLPDVRKTLRDQKLHHHVVDFFAFTEGAYEKVKHQRGMLRSALGYCVRQRDALLRFLDDGRLEMTNNRSERQLRRVAVGRNNWLFVGSDDHGQAAANLLTLIASARLHKLDPEVYLRDVFRVLPFWPRERLPRARSTLLADHPRLPRSHRARSRGRLADRAGVAAAHQAERPSDDVAGTCRPVAQRPESRPRSCPGRKASGHRSGRGSSIGYR